MKTKFLVCATVLDTALQPLSYSCLPRPLRLHLGQRLEPRWDERPDVYGNTSV